MSHAPSGEGSKAEPNLTPLLDIVLQLLMFFMMCVNFVSDQVNEGIKLPVAQSALPMSKKETDILFLNLNSKGELEVLGEDHPLKVTEWKSFLKRQYDDADRLAREKGQKNVQTVVVIRADKENDYKQVYSLLNMCKAAGYRKYQLRAMTQAA